MNAPGSVRRERQLGWVTVNGQRYPRERSQDCYDAIAQGLCPFCGEGPFIVVATHISKRHDVNRHTLRAWLGIRSDASICDPTHSAACAANRKAREVELLDQAAAQHATKLEQIAERTQQMFARLEAGKSIDEIATEFGVASNTVRNWLHAAYGDLRQHPGVKSRRSRKRGPQLQLRGTHCGKGHEFTPENTYIQPSTLKRSCRECMRLNDRKRLSGSVRQRLARERPADE